LSTRRTFLKSVGLAAVPLARPGRLLADAEPKGRPNILFIMSDDHAALATSCYGSRINTTPHIDRLAREGMRFTNCLCTNSLCAPSRAVILTGRYSHLNGITDNRRRFDGSQQTFPKLLQKAGYETAIVGKWHLKSPPTGFDYWNVLPGQGRYRNPVMLEMGEKKTHQGYATDIITDEAIRWLKRRKGGRPFCLLCHHKAVHGPVDHFDPKHAKLYEDARLPEPPTLHDDYRTRSKAAAAPGHFFRLEAMGRHLRAQPPKGLAGKALRSWMYQEFFKRYLRLVASLDENIGRLLDHLDAAGLAANTVVVYTSDQGFFLGEHGWFNKMWIYEESLRMPLLVRYPKEIKAGSVNADMVLNLDFAPTLLDFAGVPRPAEMQGRSFLSLLRGHAPEDWRGSMYYHYYGHYGVAEHYGVRTRRHKLIHFPSIGAWELFDFEKDPRELHNVYGDPAYASVA